MFRGLKVFVVQTIFLALMTNEGCRWWKWSMWADYRVCHIDDRVGTIGPITSFETTSEGFILVFLFFFSFSGRSNKQRIYSKKHELFCIRMMWVSFRKYGKFGQSNMQMQWLRICEPSHDIASTWSDSSMSLLHAHKLEIHAWHSFSSLLMHYLFIHYFFCRISRGLTITQNMCQTNLQLPILLTALLCDCAIPPHMPKRSNKKK